MYGTNVRTHSLISSQRITEISTSLLMKLHKLSLCLQTVTYAKNFTTSNANFFVMVALQFIHKFIRTITSPSTKLNLSNFADVSF